MSLNISHSQDGQGVVIYNGELILIYEKEVNLVFEKHNDAVFKGGKKGKLYLTSHRVIFVNKDQKDRMLSFAMPFHCLRSVKLEQPVFGANYLKGTVLAQPGGNWEGEVVFKLTFNRGGCIDFGQAMLHANELASRFQQYAAPPPYFAPPPAYYPAPPAYYTQQQGQPIYGFQPPTQAFPDYPQPGGVFMYDAPPPYTGIGPNAAPYPNLAASPDAQTLYGASSRPAARNEKEAEAMMSAQQNGNVSHADAGAPPPTYDEAMTHPRR